MSGTRPTILAIDDDPSIRRLLVSVLSDEGYQVLMAENGEAALRLLTEHEVDLILLDMRMPVMDGWRFAEAYRTLPGPHAPIVVITAAADASRSAAQIAADAFVAKPFDLDEVASVVEQTLRV